MAERIRRDERGIAMVTVLLVMMVLTSLSVAAMQIATHDTNMSSYDRKRDLAVQSAEQRMDEILSLLPTTPRASLCSFINTGPTSVLTNWSPVQNTSTPIRTYTTLSLFTKSGRDVSCTAPTFKPPVTPTQAILTVSAAAGVVGVSTRTMETKVLLTPRSALTKALYGSGSVTVTGNTQIPGSAPGTSDADVYSNGDVNIDQPMITISGSIYAQGAITINAKCISGDVWGKNAVVDDAITGKDCTFGSNVPGMGDITSSVSSVNMTGGSATGACTAGTTVTAGGSCAGGSAGGVTSSAPPTIAFPQLTYSATDWCSDAANDPCNAAIPSDYSIKTFTGGVGTANCIAAQNWVFGTGPGQYGNAGTPNHDYLVKVDGTCMFTNPNNSNLTLKGNLVIFANDGFNFGGLSNWHTAAGTCNTDADQYPSSRCGLYAIQPYDATLSCFHRGITIGNNTDMSEINFFAYSRCNIIAGNLTKINGQFLSGSTAEVNNNGGLTFASLSVPAISETGYDPSPVYFREIKPS